MKINGVKYKTIWFDEEKQVVKIIDQTKLPHKFIIKELNSVNNSFSLELKSSLNEFVDDLLPSDLKTSELRTLATIAIKKKILQSDLILLRGSGAYDHIKELLEKKFIVKRKQKDGRSYWLSLSEKFFQTFAVSNEYLSNIGSSNNKQQ